MSGTVALPINPTIVERSAQLRAAFASESPLADLVIIPDLLSTVYLEQALAGCDAAPLATFCGYAPADDPQAVRNEFFEPVEGPLYVTIHQRPTGPIPQLQELHDLFVAEQTLVAMEALTGIALSRDGHRSVLTSWGPWSFLGRHCDAATGSRPNRLVISLSLTRSWQRRFGGLTGFQWNGTGPTLWVEPHLNTAVVFRAFLGSVHWVEQIAGDAPERTRYTWTMVYA
jgi:hypothetical protein